MLVNGNFHCHNNLITNFKNFKSDIKGYISFKHNSLPGILYNYNFEEDIKEIIKWQNEYLIWNKDGSLNKENFQELLDNLK